MKKLLLALSLALSCVPEAFVLIEFYENLVKTTDALYSFSGAGWTWCGFLATIGGGLFLIYLTFKNQF